MAVKQLSDGGADGVVLGQSDDKVSLYGGTPAVQRSSSVQATSLVSASAWTSAHHAAFLEVMNTLEGLKAWKGSA